jgi:hypothetical protein
MGQLIAHLPPPESAYLRVHSLGVLDWGCATGEGVALLGQTLPLCRVAGLDIARSAIETARTRHPGHQFMLAEDGWKPPVFDVVVTSNCLEHLQEPFDLARRQVASSRLLYVVLVPCREYPLMDGHVITFAEESFPEYLSGFVRLAVTSFDTDPTFWAGRQLLVVYGSREYVDGRPSTDDDGVRRGDWRIYFQSPPEVRAMIEGLALRRARAESGACSGEILRRQVEERDRIIRARDEGIAWLRGLMTDQMFPADLPAKEARLGRLTTSLGWRLLARYNRAKYRYLLNTRDP